MTKMLFSFALSIGGLILGVLVLASAGIAQTPTEVLLGSRAATLDACVAPTDEMRRNHMKHLFHKRDKTVYQGIRTAEFSLNACVSCHVVKDARNGFIPVNDKDQFCSTCHERAGQRIDCFQCHRTTPES